MAVSWLDEFTLPGARRASSLPRFSATIIPSCQEVPMRKDLSRRKFLERVGLTTAGVGLSLFPDAAEAYTAIASLPKRTLGRTNAKVSILAFGCGSRFLMYEDEEKAIAALNHAIDLGITYLDTAYAYGDGKSESRVGKVTATRRKDVWMATKIPDRTRNARFEELALPAANAKNLGIIAMKVTGQEFLLGNAAGKADIDSLLRYSMSLPVTTAVVGMPTLAMLERNTTITRNFSPLTKDEMDRLRQQLTPSRDGLEHRLSGHLDGPTAALELFWV